MLKYPSKIVSIYSIYCSFTCLFSSSDILLGRSYMQTFNSFHSQFPVQNASELPKTAPKAQGNIKIRSKNYASPDCGAKIVGANPEAQHASAVLSSSQDEYALSPCNSAKIWFVVELCEAIQAKQVTTRLSLSDCLFYLNVSADRAGQLRVILVVSSGVFSVCQWQIPDERLALGRPIHCAGRAHSTELQSGAFSLIREIHQGRYQGHCMLPLPVH